MKKKVLRTCSIVLLVGILLSCCSLCVFATYFEHNGGGTYSTYINTASSFSSFYFTDNNPDMRFEYKNLKCATSGAKLEVTLYGKKVHWYNIVAPSEVNEGTVNCTNINGTANVWYGYTYTDVDCSSSSEINDKWPERIYDECPSVRFLYEPSKNNSKPVYNSSGEWRVICSY